MRLAVGRADLALMRAFVAKFSPTGPASYAIVSSHALSFLRLFGLRIAACQRSPFIWIRLALNASDTAKACTPLPVPVIRAASILHNKDETLVLFATAPGLRLRRTLKVALADVAAQAG